MEMKRCFGCMSPLGKDDVCPHCGYDRRTPNALHQLPAGTVLKEQYLVGRVLGQGGFGITYLGWDLYLDIPVAIKEYYPSGMVMRENINTLSVTGCSGDEDRFHNNRDRFMREAKMLARFSNVPEIVQIKNFFLANNTAYIVMEYIRGITLKEYVRRRGGRLEARETFAILRPIMAALEKVHKAGLIHRDISPDNIMMLRGGGAKLLDFGAVRDVGVATDVEKELSKSTEAILKQGYAPMEQYQHRGALGPWTDVYALCATVYFCLTGTVPPDAPARLLDDAPLTFDPQTGLSREQQKVLLQGMALRAADRLHSMEQLHQALFAAPISGNDDAPSPAKPPKAPEPEKPKPPQPEKGPDRKEKTGGKKWIAIAAVLTLLIAGGLGIRYLISDKPLPEPTGETILLTEETALLTEETTLPGESETLPTESEPPVADPVENAMKAFPVEDYKTAPQTAAFGTAVSREQILSITVLNTVKDAPGDAVDISREGNGKVLAWVVPNGALYDLYLGAEGGVYAPEESGTLFACYTNVKTIEFGDAFFTDSATSFYTAFYNCTALETLDLTSFNMEKVTNMGWMFAGCTALKELKLGNPDTAAVTNMECMFSDCIALTQLDASGLDTGAVRNMSNMFSGCTALEELNISGFETANVWNMASMFRACSRLTRLELEGLNTGYVQDMSYMFAECDALKELDVSRFRTGNSTDMHGMFWNCTQLEKLDVSGFNTQKVVDLSYMFGGCTALRELDVSGFVTTRAGKMNHMFFGCESLTQLEVGGFETGNATDMYAMFGGCKSLTRLDVSGFDTALVINMGHMFSGCNKLQAVDVSNFSTGNVEAMNGMFQDCWAVEMLKVDNFDTGNVTNMSYMFTNCISLKELNLSRFRTEKVTDMKYMFNGCSALRQLDVKNFDTRNVESMQGMFLDCSGLTYLGVGRFDTARVRNMRSMFRNCSGLTNLDVSDFATGSVTDMGYMFCECRGLRSLNLSNFNTAGVTDMSHMLYGCDSLTNLKLGEFSTASVTNHENFMEPQKRVNGKPWEELFA